MQRQTDRKRKKEREYPHTLVNLGRRRPPLEGGSTSLLRAVSTTTRKPQTYIVEKGEDGDRVLRRVKVEAGVLQERRLWERRWTPRLPQRPHRLGCASTAARSALRRLCYRFQEKKKIL